MAREQTKPDHKPIQVRLAFSLFCNVSVTSPFLLYHFCYSFGGGRSNIGPILVGYYMTSKVMPNSSGKTEDMNTSTLLSLLK